MQDRATTMYNAFTRARPAAQTGRLTLLSSATHGASGSPVLDQAGLVVGLVTGRGGSVERRPARLCAARRRGRLCDRGVGRADQGLLLANQVLFDETDAPQLEPMQAHAPRAATLEAGVLCGD
ncbi:MAG: hypothetical protein WDN30_05185 [Pararobbsia sp.]